MRLGIASIRVDGGTQIRERLDPEAINDYARAIDDLPPIEVVWDGECYWLVDGFHRLAAHRQIGRLDVDALVREGTRRDAVISACAANVGHGVRRTNRDKRAAVRTLLDDPEWSHKPNERIATHAAVTVRFVQLMRRELDAARSGNDVLEEPPEPEVDPADRQGALFEGSRAPAAESELAPHVVDAARETMGMIDATLTGASSKIEGRVFAAPKRERAAVVVARLLDAYEEGEIEEAVALLPAATGAAWFAALWDAPLAFLVGAPRSEVALYLGPHREAFARAFEPFARVVAPSSHGPFSLRAPRRLCAACGAVCATGRWCPACKQVERADRTWIRDALALASAEIEAGRAPSPTIIGARIGQPWRSIARALIARKIGTSDQRARWAAALAEAKA